MKLSLAAAALHPLLHVWLSVVFNAASQVLLRIGALLITAGIVLVSATA